MKLFKKEQLLDAASEFVKGFEDSAKDPFTYVAVGTSVAGSIKNKDSFKELTQKASISYASSGLIQGATYACASLVSSWKENRLEQNHGIN